MIIGTGIDVVNIDRFEKIIHKTPALRQRLFSEEEQQKPIRSLAARFAVKEAVAKALGAPSGLSWKDCSIVNNVSGEPQLLLSGTVKSYAEKLSINHWHITLSHDEPIATAMVIAEHLSAEELKLLRTIEHLKKSN
ncbi:holo-ACP synthase [Rothia sp. P6271]|uniref:holo-ACP synthase n=1 Tax=unclassified Rothia (in: high G+C Gram-positive bacteria) TaxID=2689056 RepID=UPI003AC4E6BC